MPPCGLLNLNKPVGMTSRRVVDRVMRLGRRLKAGHAGTLDPLASGVLIVCVGTATRLIPYVQAMPKRYRGTFLLGRQSPTEDVEGPVSELVDPPIPSLDALRQAARGLTGEILQRPPEFSALKIEGRRAYDLARAGKPVDLRPRPVSVYRLEIEAYQYPELKLAVECGSGTYVRSLGRDLAASLGTAAVMSELVRLAIGSFTLEDATSLENLDPEHWSERLLPPLRAVEKLPHVTLGGDETRRVRTGQAIAKEFPQDPPELAAVSADGRLVAILRPRAVNLWGPVCNLPIETP
jgi:tRNA pseudouridine55 synthase